MTSWVRHGREGASAPVSLAPARQNAPVSPRIAPGLSKDVLGRKSLKVAAIISGDTLFDLSTPGSFHVRQRRPLQRFEQHFRKSRAVVWRERARLLFGAKRIGTNRDGTPVSGIRWIRAISASQPSARTVSVPAGTSLSDSRWHLTGQARNASSKRDVTTLR